MTKMNWTKWAAGAVVAGLALAAMPAVGQARHYTGVTPASVTPVATTSTKHTVRTTAAKKHTKLATHKKKLHAKHKPSTKLHAKKKHGSTLSKTTKKA